MLSIRNTPQAYGLIARVFHWAAALLVLILLCAGFYMTGLAFSPAKLDIYFLHKSFGILALFVVIARVLWRFGNPRVRALDTHKVWEHHLAKITHALLYLCLIFMPLSGWLMSSAGDFPAPFFGLFEMPDLMTKDEDAFRLLREFHALLAYVIIALVGLHVAGAFKHHFIDRDETLKRMTAARVGLVAGGALAVFSGGFLALALVLSFSKPAAVPTASGAVESQPARQAAAEEWAINLANSTIGFTVTQYGEAFGGEFKTFGGTIRFDPENLQDAYAHISVDIASISTGSEERDGQARSPEWFDAAQFPQAVFESESFTRTAPNQYVAAGTLAIRGVRLPLSFPFTLTTHEDSQSARAVMEANLSLNRQDYGIGQGAWKTPEIIGNNVNLTLHVEAARPAP